MYDHIMIITLYLTSLLNIKMHTLKKIEKQSQLFHHLIIITYK